MWNFKILEPGTPERNPRETEFFRLKSPSEAVVREFIQNSLDARNNEKTIKIVISFTRVPGENFCNFLDNTLKEHLIACNILHGHEYPEFIPFLILEDFGTTGLDGPYNPDARDGNFYNFWWREGISQKTEQKAGRWGLGKITFHIVSKIRTFFGLTIRNDRKTLLMGKTLLKTHELNDKRYNYFGYYCNRDFTPIEDNFIISLFNKYTGITRKVNEIGFSLVIPLPLDEINFDLILKDVIQHYFYPLLDGTLRVEIHDDKNDVELNEDNLIEKASAIDWVNTEWNGLNIKDILEFVRTSRYIDPIELYIASQDYPEITQESFGNKMEGLKNSYLSRELIKFRVPIMIKKSHGSKHESYFTILLKRFPALNSPFECYIRSGILISGIKKLGKRPVAGLFIADDTPICEFLGDCETPAHTEWNERTEGFAEKYTSAARILRFIKNSLPQIISFLDEPPVERQADFLRDIFSIPVNPELKKDEKELTPVPEVPTIEKNKDEFTISPIYSGFRITLNRQLLALKFPFQATVKIAYNTFRGNPFSRYDKFDFDLASSLINIEAKNCNILSRKFNKLELEITGQDFNLRVTGFDPHRDLVVVINKVQTT